MQEAHIQMTLLGLHARNKGGGHTADFLITEAHQTSSFNKIFSFHGIWGQPKN